MGEERTKEDHLGQSRLKADKRTQLWRVRSPKDPRISEAARILREGGLVAFPTETVYGLGANGLDGEACARIFAAKGRPSDNPLILHVASLEEAKALAREWPEKAQRAANKLWPGPLTLIVPAAAHVPRQVTAGLDTVAIRFPKDAVAQALIEAAGVPVAAPSANLSGRPSPTMAGHVLEDLGGRIDVILDGGPCPVGLESTILDLSAEPPAVLRPGDITAEALARLLGPLDSPAAAQAGRQGEPAPQAGSNAATSGRGAALAFLPQGAGSKAPRDLAQRTALIPKAPGMKYRHYAPKAPVTVLQGTPKAVAAFVLERLLPEYSLWESRGKADSCRKDEPAFAAASCQVPAVSWEKTALLLSRETWHILNSALTSGAAWGQSRPPGRSFDRETEERGGYQDRIPQALEELPDSAAFFSCLGSPDWYCRDMGRRSRPREMGARLYDALRACDRLGVRRIFAEGSTGQRQGAAVMNRLKKAAGNRILSLD